MLTSCDTAIQSCSLSHLFEFDRSYLRRIRLRRIIMDAQPRDVIGCNPVANEAVDELYEWVFGTYLPRRFPTMFVLERSRNRWPYKPIHHVRNLTTMELVPLKSPRDPKEALKVLGSHVDCDMLLLLPTAEKIGHVERAMPTPPATPYHLHAFSVCFPSGFNTADKLGLPLAGIHAPVPGYGEKLERSMDRFFARLPFGQIVQRANWACQTDNELLKMDGNHLHNASSAHQKMTPSETTPTEKDFVEWKQASEDVDPAKCMLRVERQTLHRLERTRALLFAFKTYLTPLSEVRDEGLGPALADAVDGLAEGNVPAMRVYKRSVVWGPKVTAFLREPSEEKVRDNRADYSLEAELRFPSR